ncbi:MAG: Rieske 2Fe-2S domain-containing protein [Actinophytocola sp.]|nr:Rieske 2Fe-2S domain-containing protein [Actinophytocola sp.]
MERTIVGRATDLPPGKHLGIMLGNRPVCVANVDGEFVAFRDSCPHQGARLSTGTVGGTMLPSDPHSYQYGLEGCVVRCPWHGWEFDMRTGESLFDRGRRRIAHYEVQVEDGNIVLVH